MFAVEDMSMFDLLEVWAVKFDTLNERSFK